MERPDPTVLFDPRPQSQKTVGSLGAGLWSYLPLILQGPPRPGSALSGTIQLMCVEFKKALKKIFFVSKLRSLLCTPRHCVFLLSALLSARWMWTQQQLPRLSPSASHWVAGAQQNGWPQRHPLFPCHQKLTLWSFSASFLIIRLSEMVCKGWECGGGRRWKEPWAWVGCRYD